MYQTLSILGDSISTYAWVSNDEKARFSTFGNPYFYKDPFPLEKTYFMRVMDAFGMSLCVNNSWSGGTLSGEFAFSGCNRARALARDDGTMPDLIIVFMGMNDLGRNVPLEKFSKAYKKTLLTLAQCYPTADVLCVTLPDRAPYVHERTLQYNREITRYVKAMGARFFLCDLFHSPLKNDDYYNNTVDGLHPDEDGMRIIADRMIDAINEHLK